MSDIFLSYAREDRERVRPLVERLEEHGWSVWWDRKILPGEKWAQVVEAELESCRAMVVVWTEASVQSDWVLIETCEGDERGILVPVRLSAAKLPLQFRRLQAADLTEWDGSVSHPELQTTFSALEAILRVPAPTVEPTVEQEETPRAFCSPDEIRLSIRLTKGFKSYAEDPTTASTLLFFETSKQHTWLVATRRRLYCVLDDTRNAGPLVDWSLHLDSVIERGSVGLQIQAKTKGGTDRTGLVPSLPTYMRHGAPKELE